MLDICINGEMFSLRTLIDSRVDVNILNSKIAPVKYLVKSFRQVIRLGNKDLLYQVPQASKASIFFKEHCIKLKFVVVDIPVDCILGNVFLATVEPHGSKKLKNGKDGYFIFVPISNGILQTIKLTFVSTPRVSSMVQAIHHIKKGKK